MTKGAQDKPQEKPHYVGHRQRLREKFVKNPDSLADYELLEMILMSAIPRGDVKPLAKDLIKKFGSFSGVIMAPVEKLEGIKGVGAAVIASLKLHQQVMIRLSRSEFQEKHILSSWEAVLKYCRVALAYCENEQFAMIYLDRKNQVLGNEILQTGTIDRVVLYPREIVKKILNHNAAAVILVHNHPTGDVEPSKPDIELTDKIKKALHGIDVVLHDHLIISRHSHYSFRHNGLI